MMALMIVGLTAGSAAASEWEAIGGISITNVTLDQWNAKIDSVNSVLGAERSGLTNSTNTDKMDNIDKVPILFLGAEREINDKWAAEFRYEYIFGGVEGEADVNLPPGVPGGPVLRAKAKHKAELEVKMHGLAALAKYKINDNWSTRGGIGIYDGTKTKKVKGPAFGSKEDDSDYDLDAVSYRLGIGYERSFAQNWSFNGNIDYLYMEIEDEDPGEKDPNIYSKGFSYGLGLTYHF